MSSFYLMAAEAARMITRAISEVKDIEPAAHECLRRLQEEWGPKWSGVSRGFKPDHALAWAASIIYNILAAIEDTCKQQGGEETVCFQVALGWLGGLQQMVVEALLRKDEVKNEKDGEAMFM